MLQYILTALAGIAIGVVSLRLWQAHAQGAPAAEPAGPDDVAIAVTDEGEAALGAASPPWRARLARLRPSHMLLAAAVVAVAGGIAFSFGDEDRSPPSQALSLNLGGMSAPQAQLDDVDTMIDRLAARLEENPEDGEGYRMLGWSYVMTGRPDEAIAPYERALELIPDQANVHAGYGEALTAIAGNSVTPAAKTAFETALRLDPAEPRARYFLALWQAQNGEEVQALDAMVELANSAGADAPWQADVRREIASLSDQLGVDVSSRLTEDLAAAAPAGEPPALDPGTVQAAQALPPEQRQSMIAGMVDGLAQRLASNPEDPDGWIRLLRSRMVLEQAEQAARDLESARAGLGLDEAGIARVNQAAAELGVPGA